MKKKIVLILIIISVLFIQFTGELYYTDNQQKTICYIKKKEKDQFFEKFFYNSENKLEKYISGDNEYQVFEYDTLGKLKKVKQYSENEFDSYNVYKYNPKNQIIAITEFTNEDDKWQKSSYSEYTYKDNRIVLQTDYDQDTDTTFKAVRKVEFNYDKNGNVIKSIEYQADGKLNRVTENKFDNNKNPYKAFNFSIFDEEIVNTNNETVSISKDAAGKTLVTISYTYQYNTQSYPTLIAQTRVGKTIKYEWNYDCK